MLITPSSALIIYFFFFFPLRIYAILFIPEKFNKGGEILAAAWMKDASPIYNHLPSY